MKVTMEHKSDVIDELSTVVTNGLVQELEDLEIRG